MTSSPLGRQHDVAGTDSARHLAPPHRARGIKVPELTLLFWIIKILTTGMGETASDWLARTIDPVIAVLGALLALSGLLAAQLRATRYRPWLYWATVAMVSVFGTMAADVLHVVIGIPYVASTIGFAVAVAAVLLLWHRAEGTLDIHSIVSTRRECFYWTTVCATFALGTAAGDLTATGFGLGYLASGVLFAVAFAVPVVAHRWRGLGAVPAFWVAYVLTRPLGASFADWIAVPPARGGLDLGTGAISLVLLVAIATAVAVHARQDRLARRG
ncbi:COG4705 family protein [Pseudonocardia dioxanivorans]|jgi:uncharacterized membrane-anchored protein|uniref:COG4705 family protein n=1 Tax=Pseudonocardia dioxanivorans TaxID=240495 RepID=UPI0018F86510|nr:hypothetical protein [Pseudonocardia dioxanivorans]